jgi:hypothetical protein
MLGNGFLLEAEFRHRYRDFFIRIAEIVQYIPKRLSLIP